MSKQTAVELLEEQYYQSEGKLTRHDFEQAKQMEKEQHFESYRQGNAFLDSDSLNFKGSFEQYYNETYGGNYE